MACYILLYWGVQIKREEITLVIVKAWELNGQKGTEINTAQINTAE